MERLMNRKHWLWNFVLLNLLASIAAVAIAATGPSLLEMSDLLDGIEKQDFQAAINKANACTRARNFPCAETELAKAAKAAKAANSGQDKKTLLASRQSLANERQQLANEIRRAEEARQAQIRREEEEKQAQIRREEEREARREREEQQARAAEERQSTSDYYAAIGAQILQRGAENAALLNRVDRQTIAALDESNRVRAAQAAERDRARAEREEREAERRREAEHRREAERERAAREAAERSTRATVVASAPELPQYKTPVVTIPKGRETCPPGSSPARQANGQYVTIPPAAYCIKDPQATSGQQTAQGADRNGGVGGVGGVGGADGSAGQETANNTRSDQPRPTAPARQPAGIEWGPVQMEAFAICVKSTKSGRWWCDGPLQEATDNATAEEGLRYVGCSPATHAAGANTKDGRPGELYRCGFGLRSYDRNIAKIHRVVTAPRSYMCRKNFLSKCTDFYNGQDKR